MSTDRGPERFGLVGLGATGAATLRHWLSTDPDVAVEVVEPSDRRAAAVLRDLSDAERRRVRLVETCSPRVGIVVVATPAGEQLGVAREALEEGRSVVSLGDDPDDVAALLDLDEAARRAGSAVVVGAGLSPGLSCLLADLGADELDEVEEVAVAKTGTAGPACARQHHHALKTSGVEWLDGEWVVRSGGTGRDLLWFPGELGARDAYRAGLPEPVLLHRRFPRANRLSARMSATRRDRFTSRLPMLRPPHADGGPGGIRVEVRGRADGSYRTVVHGVMANPSHAAGVLAALVAGLIDARRVEGNLEAGACGVGELGATRALLERCREAGVATSRFEGSTAADRRPA